MRSSEGRAAQTGESRAKALRLKKKEKAGDLKRERRPVWIQRRIKRAVVLDAVREVGGDQ